MGFYGNITNSSRTTFQFDKIYPSRFEMEGNCSSDGVYNGRYVLVEYDSNLSSSTYKLPGSVIIIPADTNEYPKIYYTSQYNGTVYTSDSDKELYNSELFEYAWTNTDVEFYRYFNGANAKTALTADDLADYPLLYMEKGQVYTILNSAAKYVLFYADGTYTYTDFETFSAALTSYPNDFEESMLDEITGSDLEAYGGYEVYIANNVCFPATTNIWTSTDKTVLPGIVRAGRQYTYNIAAEFWSITDSFYIEGLKTYPYIEQKADSDNYTSNFNLDKQYFKSSRGYDSTVWQKVFVDGVEKYVMIAELNTVVPTFGISADPPSLIPINPHWGTDSTNVYYDLHWQPQWGLRVKAANTDLTTPILDPTGTIYTQDINGYEVQNQWGKTYVRDLTKDAMIYPSDVSVTWASSFEDATKNSADEKPILYYNGYTGTWTEDKTQKVPAAIYFNKDGFNSETIAYSGDLIDEDLDVDRYDENLANTYWTNTDAITLTATGLSGNIYNQHNGSYNKRAQVDTQELSIMLPSIGDTIASVWDLVYGGRDTSTLIEKTNLRNKHLEWENGTNVLNRLGLRLRGTDGNQYNTDAIETLAGCINTAHDLFGMIIYPRTKEELDHNVKSLNKNRIFYATDEEQYYRKHITYTWDEIEDDDYTYIALNNELEYLTTEKIHNGLYYLYLEVETGHEDETEWRYVNLGESPYNQADNEYYEYNSELTYYYKSAEVQYEELLLDEDNIVASFPYQGYSWYQDTEVDVIDDLKANYIKETLENFSDRDDYYKITVTNRLTLSDNYKENKYYYFDKDEDQILIESNKKPSTDNEPYYEINDNKLIRTLSEVGYEGIYAPGVYYYREAVEVGSGTTKTTQYNYYLDNSLTGENIWAHREVDEESGNVSCYCYTLLEPTIIQDETGTSIIYEASIEYNIIELTSSTYAKGVYYIAVDPTAENTDYILCYDDYSSTQTYYEKVVSYTVKPATSTVQLTVDRTIPFSNLVKYRDWTFFKKYYDAEYSQVVKYVPVNYENIKNTNELLTSDSTIYVIGEYGDWGTLPSDLENSIQNNKDGCIYISLQDQMKYDAYYIGQNNEYSDYLIKEASDFYYPGQFHYRTNDDCYILDKADEKTDENDYRQILTATKIDINIYYVEGEEELYSYNDALNTYEKITSWDNDNPENNPEHVFVKKMPYVYSDSNGKLKQGAEWNVDAIAIPNGVKLATRGKEYELQALQNYAIDTSTVNGLILKMYEMLEPNNAYTRETNTVAGSINKLNDIIAKFDRLRSRQITIVNDAGMITSAPTSTSQLYSSSVNKTNVDEYGDYINADRFPRASTVDDMQKQWITVDVNGDLESPSLVVHHNYQPVATNRETDIDMNAENINTVDISTPIVDDMGHIVGKNEKYLILPTQLQNLKTSYAYNEDMASVTIAQLTERVALLESLLYQLVTVDEENNSVVVMSEEELDEALAWPQVTVRIYYNLTTHQLDDDEGYDEMTVYKNGMIMASDLSEYFDNEHYTYRYILYYPDSGDASETQLPLTVDKELWLGIYPISNTNSSSDNDAFEEYLSSLQESS